MRATSSYLTLSKREGGREHRVCRPPTRHRAARSRQVLRAWDLPNGSRHRPGSRSPKPGSIARNFFLIRFTSERHLNDARRRRCRREALIVGRVVDRAVVCGFPLRDTNCTTILYSVIVKPTSRSSHRARAVERCKQGCRGARRGAHIGRGLVRPLMIRRSRWSAPPCRAPCRRVDGAAMQRLQLTLGCGVPVRRRQAVRRCSRRPPAARTRHLRQDPVEQRNVCLDAVLQRLEEEAHRESTDRTPIGRSADKASR